VPHGSILPPVRCDVAAAGTGVAALVPRQQGWADMTRAGSASRVPSTIREVFDDVAARTDAFCGRHLDEEYAELCTALTAKLARKRLSPLTRGGRDIWAAGIVYAIGRVNVLTDPNQTPHLR
jgi:hypothetical protein